MRPGPAVLASFGASADPVSLPGGEGTAWRAGEVVLKPAGDPRVARWTADLYRDLGHLAPVEPLDRPPGRWLPRATAARHRRRGLGGPGPAGRRLGGLAVAARRARFLGRRLPGLAPADRGEPGVPRRAGRRPAPSWLGRDGSQWTIGDQVAWGEHDPGSVLAAAPGPLAGQLRSLLAALRPVRLPAQLIHGDLGGNVLFAAGEPPAVIDFSPYWRPAGLALAVAAVDALTWSGADPAILDELAGEPELDQLLAHAHVCRLVTEVVFRRGDPDASAGLETVARTSQPVTVLLMKRLAAGRIK